MHKRWQDWTTLGLGIYVFLSPWILRYAAVQPATASANWLGAIIVMISAIALAAPRIWEEWGNFVLGILLAIAPGSWVLARITCRCSMT